jgi:WD40 repeat protein
MPDRVRTSLIRALDAETAEAARDAIVLLLESNPPPGESFAADLYRLNIAVQRWFIYRDRKRRRDLNHAAERVRSSRTLRDYTLLLLAERGRNRPLVLTLPDRLLPLLYRHGIPVLGLRSLTRASLAVLLASALWFTLRPQSSASAAIALSELNLSLTVEHEIPARNYAVTSVAFSPDGETLTSGTSDRTIHVWEVETGTEIASYGVETGPHRIYQAFSADGRTLALGGATFLELLDITNGEETALSDVDSNVHSLSFSADGGSLAVGTHKGIVLWDVKSRQVKRRIYSVGRGLGAVAAVSPDGGTLAVGMDAVRLFDADSGNMQHVCELPDVDFVTSVKFSPDGRYIAAGTRRGTLSVWGAPGWSLIAQLSTGGEQTQVAFSPDSRLLIGVGGSAELTLLDISNGQRGRLRLKPDSEPTSSAFSADGETVAVGWGDGSILIFRLGAVSR